MATTNDLKNGMVLNLDGQLWSVVWFQHHKPGKGGAVVRTKLKSVLSGKVVDRTFNADVKVDIAQVDKRDMQYLYHDGSAYVFMDTDDLRPGALRRGGRRRRQGLPARQRRGDGRRQRRACRCTSSCRRRSSSPSSTPSRACRATAPAAAPSRPAWRPASRSRCRCSSPPARRSRSTPATAAISVACPG